MLQGVGKSCLVDQIVTRWLEDGERVAILAVDPSSPVSGGALLGDRNANVISRCWRECFLPLYSNEKFARGVPSHLSKMVDLLVEQGWSKVIIETVGCGQSEIRVVAVADRILLVEGPARGDVIQAEKAGILELADIVP